MKQAPAFSLYNPFAEQDMTNEDFAGTPLLLTFWTSWCPDSQRDLQKKEALYSKIDENKLAMLNVNVQGRERVSQAGQQYAKSRELNVPMAEDQGTDTYERYQCQGVPTTVLITAAGEIAKQFGDKTPFEDIMYHVATLVDV